jgi:hypothetical protein
MYSVTVEGGTWQSLANLEKLIISPLTRAAECKKREKGGNFRINPSAIISSFK